MPTVLRVGQYRFFFYSEEGNEPVHIHVEAAEHRAKFWLSPISIVWSDGFRSGELKEIFSILELNRVAVLEAWNVFFAGE